MSTPDEPATFSDHWELYPTPEEADYSGRIIVKLTEEANRDVKEISAGKYDFKSCMHSVQNVFTHSCVEKVEPVFTRSRAELQKENQDARRRSGKDIPDPTTFYTLTISDYTAATNMLSELRTTPGIEIAYAAPKPPPPPATPDLTSHQGYLKDPTTYNGYGVEYAWTQPGGDGSGVRLIDIEYAWILEHEDLGMSSSDMLYGDIYTNYGYDHGTASVGCSFAQNNGFGMKGIVYNTDMKVISSISGGSWVLANAISYAVSATSPGDVILLEQQGYNGSVYCPVEYYSDVYTAIANATAAGRTIIEPAGNGYANLDDASWGGIFNRSTRDSGAIIVGAGTATARERVNFSDYGSRVDIQGWGDWSVATLGYGDLYTRGDVTSEYTSTFSGTSSASALSAGIAAALQSYVRSQFNTYLPALQLRSNLVAYGQAQYFGLSGNIGPLPNLSNSIVNVVPEPFTTVAIMYGCIFLIKRRVAI